MASLLLFVGISHAGAASPLLQCVDQLQRIGQSAGGATTCPTGRPGGSSEWVSIPEADAQCTPGAKAAGHSAKIRWSRFRKEQKFSLELLPAPAKNAVIPALKARPGALYVGNGPIYMQGTHLPNGYVKSGGKVLNALDCVNFRSNPGNLGRENSVFLRYRPRAPGGGAASNGDWKYRVISTDQLCRQLQPDPYVKWLASSLPTGRDVQQELKERKKWEPEEDLVSADQIDFALQSGPGVLRDGKNLLSGYNSATRNRSYIGVDERGQPVVVEADGNVGSYCLGEYLKGQGVRDLLHRDSFVSDAAWREKDGSISGYPGGNPDAVAASLLIVSE